MSQDRPEERNPVKKEWGKPDHIALIGIAAGIALAIVGVFPVPALMGDV